MKTKVAYIFLSADADSVQHRNQVTTDSVELTIVVARNYADATAVAIELVDDGITSIELCGGFGNAGTAQIVTAVDNIGNIGNITVGVVRFDLHP